MVQSVKVSFSGGVACVKGKLILEIQWAACLVFPLGSLTLKGKLLLYILSHVIVSTAETEEQKTLGDGSLLFLVLVWLKFPFVNIFVSEFAEDGTSSHAIKVMPMNPPSN